MKTFFEYFYFRFAQKFFKQDGAGSFGAILNVSMVQFLWILNLYLFIKSSIDNSQVRKLYLYEKVVALIIIGLLHYFNHKKYTKRYFEFRERWGNEEKTLKEIRWYLLFLVIFLSWCLIFVNGWIFGRIHFR